MRQDSGRLIAEHDGADGSVDIEYGAIGDMLLGFVRTGVGYLVLTDHAGRPVMSVKWANGAIEWAASYRPFGEVLAENGPEAINLRFPGQYQDQETGLHYNTFRTYHPGLGRYVESDPIGLSGGWNTYAYVRGNPVMRVDPRGLFAICPPDSRDDASDYYKPGCGDGLEWAPRGGGGGGGGPGKRANPIVAPAPAVPTQPSTPGDVPAPNVCKHRTCKNTYPDYILCTALSDYHDFNSVRQAANSFYGRNTKPDRGKPATDGPLACKEKGGWHWNVYFRGDFQGSITSCTCCDDSKFGEPELKTKYRAHYY